MNQQNCDYARRGGSLIIVSTTAPTPERIDAVASAARDVADAAEEGDVDGDVVAATLRDLADVVQDVGGFVAEHESAINYAGALESQKIAGQVQDLKRDDVDVVEQPTTIQQFAAMPPEARASLSASDRRAAFVFENFTDWAQTAGRADGPVLTTSTGADGRAKLKELLESKLQEHGFDEDGLAWNEVYRAMKMVARKSGGSTDCVDDGAFTYIHNWSDPWTDGDDTVKVLILDDPDQLQFHDDH